MRGKLGGGAAFVLRIAFSLAFVLVLAALLLPWTVRLRAEISWTEGEGLRAGLWAWLGGRRLWTLALPVRQGAAAGGGAGRRGRLPAAVRRLLARLPDRRRALHLVRALAPAARYLRRHLTVVHLDWETRVGLGDARACALATAVLQMGQSLAALALSGARPAAPLHVRVLPDYHRPGLETRVDCALAVAPLRVLAAGVVLAVAWRRAVCRARQVSGPRPPHTGHGARPC